MGKKYRGATAPEVNMSVYECPNCGGKGEIVLIEKGTSTWQIYPDPYGGLATEHTGDDYVDESHYECAECGAEAIITRTYFCDQCGKMHYPGDKFATLECLEYFLRRLEEMEDAAYVIVSEDDIGGWPGKEGILITASNDMRTNCTANDLFLRVGLLQRKSKRGVLNEIEYANCEDGTVHKITERDCEDFLTRVGFFKSKEEELAKETECEGGCCARRSDPLDCCGCRNRHDCAGLVAEVND